MTCVQCVGGGRVWCGVVACCVVLWWRARQGVRGCLECGVCALACVVGLTNMLHCSKQPWTLTHRVHCCQKRCYSIHLCVWVFTPAAGALSGRRVSDTHTFCCHSQHVHTTPCVTTLFNLHTTHDSTLHYTSLTQRTHTAPCTRTSTLLCTNPKTPGLSRALMLTTRW